MPENPSLPSELVGKEVLLKKITLSDAEDLYQIFSNSKAVEYLDLSPAKSLEEVAAWIRKSINTAPAFHAAWAVYDQKTKRIMGAVSYYDREPWQDRVRISYAFLPKSLTEKKLYDALKCVVGVCIERLKSHRIEAWVSPRDITGLKALKKLKFQKEGILRDRLRFGNSYRSVVSLSLLTQSKNGHKYKRDNSVLLWKFDDGVKMKPYKSSAKENDENIGVGLAVSAYLQGDQLIGFAAGNKITVNAPHKILKSIIELADGLHTLEEIIAAASAGFDRKNVKGLLKGMLSQGVLVESERRLESQWNWVRNPPIYYANITDDKALQLALDASRKVSSTAKGDIVLNATDSAVESILQKRKTTRDFADTPLTDTELSEMLYAAYGVLNSKTHKHSYDFARRVVPSAGGIYSLVLTWIQWMPTKKIAEGIYRINFGTNRTIGFTKLSGDYSQIFRSILDPLPVTKAHGILMLSADFALPRSKYGNRAVPYALLEAGHIAQNIQLVAADLGKGVWEIGGFTEKEIKSLIETPTCEPVLAIALGNVAPALKLLDQSHLDVQFNWIAPPEGYKPPFHLARAQIRTGNIHTDWCWGRSESPVIAAQKSLGEAVERYACQSPGALKWARPGNLERFISPEKFVSYSSVAYKRKDFPFAPFSLNKEYPWINAQRVDNGNSVPVLADLVYFFDTFGKKYKKTYTATSTSGAAAYYTTNGAIERAVLELLERHMFMLHWLGHISPAFVKFDTLPYAVQARIMEMNANGWTVHVLLMGTEPAISILMFAQHMGLGMTRIAAASGFSAEDAIYHSLEEVESSLPSETSQHEVILRGLTPKKVHSANDHGDLYLTPRYFEKANWLLNSKTEIAFPTITCRSRSADDIFDFFMKKGMMCYVLDITPKLDLSHYLKGNLKVIRVLIERTLPISFGVGQEPLLTNATFGSDEAKSLRTEIFPHPFN